MNTTDSNRPCPKCAAPVPADAPQGLCPQCVFAGAAITPSSGSSSRAATATGEIPTLDRLRAAFPQLEILELIGRGGMGFVFKARQPHLDRLVALKLLPDKLARDPHFAERFNREGRVLARLNHSNIVSVFDFGRTDHFYFLTMELVDGVNLRQAMQAGRFSPAEALAIVPKICEALQYAHDQGVLHRDIKPENILLDSKGRVKIADFGIAKLVEEEPDSAALTGTGAALGTLHYMAPEQLERPAEVDHRADIYSLGVVFYELLTGELPIGRFAPPSARTPVGTAVDDVVFRTLEKDPDKRFQSAGAVKTEVEHLTGGGRATDAQAIPASSGGPTGPHGTAIVVPPSKPAYAFRAFAGAAMVGASLVKPLSIVVSRLTGRGGVLKWVFLGALAAAFALLILPAPLRPTNADLPRAATNGPTMAIRFTVTAVELHEEEGARWLTMDYVEQVRGDCERFFRYDAKVPGFTQTTRTRSYMTSTTPGFAPVLHHRVLWKLPDSLPEAETIVLRDLVAREWVGKGATIEPGDERILFKSLVPEGGTLAAFVGTGRRRPDPNAPRTSSKATTP